MTRPTTPQPHFPSPYARPSIAPYATHTLTTDDGAELACFCYAKHGVCDLSSREVCLLIHGNGEEHGIFGPIIDALAELDFVICTLDSRGQGKSSLGQAQLSYELMAADAKAALLSFGFKTAHILGFSDGGIEALITARDWPEHVQSLCVLGANLTPEGVIDEGWDIEGSASLLEAWAAHTWPKEVNTELLSPTPEQAACQAALLRLMLREPQLDPASLCAISCPASVVVGEFDCIRDDESVAIARALPHARFYVVPGQGHTLPKYVPQTITEIFCETIARVQNQIP